MTHATGQSGSLERHLGRRWRGSAGGIGSILLLLGVAGCHHGGASAERVHIANESIGPVTVAVAPALNLSGSRDFDPDRFADFMASELSFVDGVQVVPVSRVLVILGAQEAGSVESPEHALELTRLLGVDAILVFAVTEYDPYDPPSIGITAQLYGRRSGPGGGRVDPVALSEAAQPVQVGEAVSRPGLLAQTQQVLDGAHDAVRMDVKTFARARDDDIGPYGWRKYMVSQQHFMQFCCHATVEALFSTGAAPAHAERAAGKVRTP